ncbi:MAG: MFS transporter [Kiritimatiellaceae bacterium TMED266]|jgi:sugar (glycoside-pentoside-hexuronide) transporter|nr:MAG: MFS transporter [Kiritimatiellaceae bacterium TMED266]
MKPLRKLDIFNYSIGDLGINLNFQLIAFFLAYFYTDVFGLSPAHMAGLFLAARVWDAVNDPLMGYVADHTRSRWGRFRPYLLFGALPLNLIMIACFYVPELSGTAKIVYAYVTYILHGMLFTAVGLPYSSISAVLTQDQQERAVISTFRMFFAIIIAMSLVSIGVRPFIARFDNEQAGFFSVALLFGLVSTILLLLTFWRTRERVEVPRETYGFKDVWPIVRSNDALLTLALAMFFNTCFWVTANQVALYYFKYILKNEDLFSVFFLYMLPANIVGVLLVPLLTKRLGKLKVFMGGSLLVGLSGLTRHLLPVEFLEWFIGLSIVGTIGGMFCSITQWGMVPDTVEYGEWKSGIRSEGIPFAFFSFTQKAAMAVASAMTGWILSGAGYVANTDLAPAAEKAIRLLFNVLPAVYSLICMVVLYFYKLDRDTFDRILVELKKRRSA